jgi:hypothetical protein
MSSEVYGLSETIDLPITAALAAQHAVEIYQLAANRSVLLLRIGTEDLGHFRVVSLATGVTAGGYKQIVATYQRVHVS